MLGIGATATLAAAADALPGRATEIPLRNVHHVHGRPLRDAFDGLQRCSSGWGVSGARSASTGRCLAWSPPLRIFRRLYAEPTYREVVPAKTGPHRSGAGGVRPGSGGVRRAMQLFLGKPRPEPRACAGNDAGTQYRSGQSIAKPGKCDAALDSAH